MGNWLHFFRTLLLHRLFYYALAWLVAVSAAAAACYSAWHAFDNARRPDGNDGHVSIDFGGQWVMGRLLVVGHGHDLYDRERQREVLARAYPVEDQAPPDPARTDNRSDAEWLMFWLMGNDEGDGRHVGGPLYPPVNAFYCAPLALFPVRVAYRVNQAFAIFLVFLTGLGVSYLTRGNVWWPVATTFLIIFPGYLGSLNLGQNAALTLTILVWGWALVVRGRPGWGGVVWGLLAFKPVWALSFFLVPLLGRRWRTCLAMVATGAAIGLLTLPFVGVQSWLDWLHVGREAAVLYNTDNNWIHLSRDVLSIPRRHLLDFTEGGHGKELTYYPPDRNGPGIWWHLLFGPGELAPYLLPAFLGWGLLLAFFEGTVRGAVLRLLARSTPPARQRPADPAAPAVGPSAAFLFLGAWLCCYHFMYYDVLLAALPVLLLFTEPAQYLKPVYLVLIPLAGPVLDADLEGYHRVRLTEHAPPRPPVLRVGYHNIWVFNRMAPSLTVLLLATVWVFYPLHWGTYYGPPWDTYCLMVLWLWCGVLAFREARAEARKRRGETPVERAVWDPAASARATLVRASG
jgi:hypothetical protein